MDSSAGEILIFFHSSAVMYVLLIALNPPLLNLCEELLEWDTAGDRRYFKSELTKFLNNQTKDQKFENLYNDQKGPFKRIFGFNF
jgi:hypothetical protein